MNALCDTVPQFCRELNPGLLKQSTGTLEHTHFLNAGITLFQKCRYLAYRTEQRPFCSLPMIHICQVSEYLVPCSPNFTIPTVANTQGWRVDYLAKYGLQHVHRAEDPRLIVHNDELYLFYTDGFKMYYAALDLELEDGILVGVRCKYIICPKPPLITRIAMDKKYDGREKNWSPFSYEGQLWVIYSVTPFVLMNLETREVVQKDTSFINKIWRYGFIKGGTPAVRTVLGGMDVFLTIFHSTTIVDGKCLYYAGALVFDASTLKICGLSRYPLISPFLDADHRRHSDNYVVFPCGLLIEDNIVLVTFGYNDYAIRVYATTKENLEYNLNFF